MTSENGNGLYMPVAPAFGYGGNGGGFGNFGGDGWWLILLFLLCGNGMWGGFGGMGGMMWPMMMGGMGAGFGMDYLYPWLNNSQHISDGFRDQQIQSTINGVQQSITSGFGDVQLGIAGVNQNICNTGNNITGAVRDGFSAAEISANGRQMANMQQGFGIQSAIQGGAATTAAGIADLKYTVAQEGCNDRAALSGALNSILAHIDQRVQSVNDKLCQLELDGVKRQLSDEQRENANLRSDLMYARGQASQVEQTAALRTAGATIANQAIQELRSCPIPAQPVYGNQPIFQCAGPVFGNNGGCGCNGNVGGFNGTF